MNDTLIGMRHTNAKKRIEKKRPEIISTVAKGRPTIERQTKDGKLCDKMIRNYFVDRLLFTCTAWAKLTEANRRIARNAT